MAAPDPLSAGEGSPARDDYVDRSEALRLLGVKPQTLYSYVSRGLIRRITPPQQRASYYSRSDVQRLRARSIARSGHGPAAAGAMQWGEPVLATAITEITPAGPRYRAWLAVDLARAHYSYEGVAEYLWCGGTVQRGLTWASGLSADPLARQLGSTLRRSPEVHIRELLTEVVMALRLAEMRPPAGPEVDLVRARRLLHAMAGSFGCLGPQRRFCAPAAGEPIAHCLARALGIRGDRPHLQALDAALILLADHEFTPATFAARIAASVECDLYSCVGAALQVQFGSRLGLRFDQVEGLLAARTAEQGGTIEDEHLALRCAPMPIGFSHPLYAAGDPRADCLADMAMRFGRRRRMPGAASAPAGARAHLTLDEALVLFCRALDMPRHVASGLMAFGRAAGWIAHVFEQRAEASLIRPRGKFVGAAHAAPTDGAPPATCP